MNKKPTIVVNPFSDIGAAVALAVLSLLSVCAYVRIFSGFSGPSASNVLLLCFRRGPHRLNTCISTRNYIYFYFLGLTGSLLYCYMLAVGVIVQLLTPVEDLRKGFGSESGARAAWGVFDVVTGWVAVSFVALAAFHTYLLCLGLGTYDWVVLQVRRVHWAAAARVAGSSQ